MLGLTHDEVHGTQEQKETPNPFWGVSGRRLLQVTGTELFRDRLPQLLPEMYNVWIRRLEKDLEDHKGHDICISDVRFADEAKFIQARGGIVVKLWRSEKTTEKAVLTHVSETQQVPYDFLVENNGTKEELFAKIAEIIKGK